MATPFGQRLKQARKRAKLTQAQAAERISVSQGTLSELENDAHSSGHTTAFAKLYGVDAHWLATGEGEMAGQPVPAGLSASEFDLLQNFRNMSADDKSSIAAEIAVRSERWQQLRREVLASVGIDGEAAHAPGNVTQIPARPETERRGLRQTDAQKRRQNKQQTPGEK